MYVCVRACVCVFYVCVCKYIHTHTYMLIYLRTYIHVWCGCVLLHCVCCHRAGLNWIDGKSDVEGCILFVSVSVCVCMRACVFMYVHVCHCWCVCVPFSCMYTQLRAYTCIYQGVSRCILRRRTLQSYMRVYIHPYSHT